MAKECIGTEDAHNLLKVDLEGKESKASPEHEEIHNPHPSAREIEHSNKVKTS